MPWEVRPEMQEDYLVLWRWEARRREEWHLMASPPRHCFLTVCLSPSLLYILLCVTTKMKTKELHHCEYQSLFLQNLRSGREGVTLTFAMMCEQSWSPAGGLDNSTGDAVFSAVGNKIGLARQ